MYRHITAEVLSNPRYTEVWGQFVKVSGVVYRLGAYDKNRDTYAITPVNDSIPDYFRRTR